MQSREERKLEAIMKAFERLEKQSTKRRDSVSKSDTKPDKPEIKIEVNVEVFALLYSISFISAELKLLVK